MPDPRIVLLLGGPARPGEPSPLASLVLMGTIFAIFYFVLFLPMRTKQRKLDQMIKALKPGDKVIVNPGIFGTIEGVEEGAFHVRIAEKTRIKVLRSAIAGLQAEPVPAEKK
jgi:preprotein translocase YajC subunit